MRDGWKWVPIYASLIFAAGLIIGGWILGAEIQEARTADRFVMVRGLAERTVKADLAIWRVPFVESGNDLQAAYAKSEQDQTAVLNFLSAQGIPKSDLSLGQPTVLDRMANQFSPANSGAARYIVQREVTVRSKNVDRVSGAVQRTSELVAHGVVLSGGGGYAGNQGAVYLFTVLNSIKPEMITEATRNARVAAERFAADSHSKVGNIRQASQGLFTIADADAAASGGTTYSSGTGIMKNVRVVTTVEYYLVK